MDRLRLRLSHREYESLPGPSRHSKLALHFGCAGARAEMVDAWNRSGRCPMRDYHIVEAQDEIDGLIRLRAASVEALGVAWFERAHDGARRIGFQNDVVKATWLRSSFVVLFQPR